MGIYYSAVDIARKLCIEPPRSFANKYPGICHPTNPFSGMVVMKNCQGYNFEIVDDCRYEVPDDFKDVTESVYEEYLDKFPFLKEEIKDDTV